MQSILPPYREVSWKRLHDGKPCLAAFAARILQAHGESQVVCSGLPLRAAKQRGNHERFRTFHSVCHTTLSLPRGQQKAQNPAVMKQSTISLIVFSLLTYFALSPKSQAITPAPDGGYPNGNTAEGQNALLSLTTGAYNTAVGFLSLKSNAITSFNTAVGAGTLLTNSADQNTAIGAAALLSNTTGGQNTGTGAFALLNNTTGVGNTAVGAGALAANSTGPSNTAVGFQALYLNTTNGGSTATGFQALFANTGYANTADGYRALYQNDSGLYNTATGSLALFSNTSGNYNTADGVGALYANSDGHDNTALGYQALTGNTGGSYNNAIGRDALVANSGDSNNALGWQALVNNTDGGGNTAVGDNALYSNMTSYYNVAIGNAALYSNTAGYNTALGSEALDHNTSGSINTAIGRFAGTNATTGDGNVYLGAEVMGVAGESNHTYIRNIDTTTVSGGNADYVTVDTTTGLLGHLSSSRRYKEDIKPMENASETVYRLKPVTYRYKKEVDPSRSPAFGLVAEEVAEVNSALVACNAKGQPESVHYEAVNAMLLNEFLKEHQTVQELKKQVAELTAGLQRVSAQLQMNKSAPQTAQNAY